MKQILLIVPDSQSEADSFRRLLTSHGYGITDVSSDRLPTAASLEPAGLVLVPACIDDPTPLLSALAIPYSLPALALGPDGAPPWFQAKNTDRYLIDYLEETSSDQLILARIAFLLRVQKIIAERESYLQSHSHYLDWFSTRDGQTGLFNRYHFTRLLPDLFRQAASDGRGLALLLLDLDYFSDINTTCGRSFGDFVLNELAARITTTTPETAKTFRLSGGEFAVLLPGGDIRQAHQTADELRHCCETKPFTRNTTSRVATLSIGVANLNAHQPTSIDEFVTMAETALYRAKANGRNRTAIYAPREVGTFTAGTSFDTVKLAIQRLLGKTRNSTISSLQLLARDISGPAHKDHLERVNRYINLFCTDLGLTPPVIHTLQNAATLHTSIRHLIHNDLMTKAGKFNREETAILRDFPYKLSEIIDIFDYFSQERQILLTRTEQFDGSGYPDGLKGDEIPLGARIISILDAFAAMEAQRPHRPRLSPSQILSELKNGAGRQFDPFLVLKLLDIIERNGLLEISDTEVAELRTELHSSLARQEL